MSSHSPLTLALVAQLPANGCLFKILQTGFLACSSHKDFYSSLSSIPLVISLQPGSSTALGTVSSIIHLSLS